VPRAAHTISARYDSQLRLSGTLHIQSLSTTQPTFSPPPPHPHVFIKTMPIRRTTPTHSPLRTALGHVMKVGRGGGGLPPTPTNRLAPLRTVATITPPPPPRGGAADVNTPEGRNTHPTHDITRVYAAAAAKQASKVPRSKVALVRQVLNNNFTCQLRTTMIVALTRRAKEEAHAQAQEEERVQSQRRWQLERQKATAAGASMPVTVMGVLPMPISMLAQTCACA
jgi:hypothetical protein